jgi:hypothetical protein
MVKSSVFGMGGKVITLRFIFTESEEAGENLWQSKLCQ